MRQLCDSRDQIDIHKNTLGKAKIKIRIFWNTLYTIGKQSKKTVFFTGMHAPPRPAPAPGEMAAPGRPGPENFQECPAQALPHPENAPG